MRVDHDLQLGDPGCSGGGRAHVGAALFAGARRLPEDRVAPASGGEHGLRTVLPGPVENQVDRCAAPDAGPYGDLLNDFGVLGGLHRLAVQGLRPRPCPRGAEDHPAAQRQAQQVGQPGLRIRVMGDQQLHRRQFGVIFVRPRRWPRRSGRCPRLVRAGSQSRRLRWVEPLQAREPRETTVAGRQSQPMLDGERGKMGVRDIVRAQPWLGQAGAQREAVHRERRRSAAPVRPRQACTECPELHSRALRPTSDSAAVEFGRRGAGACSEQPGDAAGDRKCGPDA
jgi:hypothetical protein